VHGDVKPDNFGVDAAGPWFVLDVESVCKHGGIGKRVNALVKPVHTPKYAAPELLLPHPFDHQLVPRWCRASCLLQCEGCVVSVAVSVCSCVVWTGL
jgi:hypothetical protein